MSNESVLRDLFDRRERIWHESQYDLIRELRRAGVYPARRKRRSDGNTGGRRGGDRKGSCGWICAWTAALTRERPAKSCNKLSPRTFSAIQRLFSAVPRTVRHGQKDPAFYLRPTSDYVLWVSRGGAGWLVR